MNPITPDPFHKPELEDAPEYYDPEEDEDE